LTEPNAQPGGPSTHLQKFSLSCSLSFSLSLSLSLSHTHTQESAKVDTTARNEDKGGRVKLGAAAPPKGSALPVAVASGGKDGLDFGATAMNSMDLDGDGVRSKAQAAS
jgi:hypothetical protein